MSEYAKRWVSPHWERFILEAHGHFLAPQIEVMNPTPDDARVDVKWFLDDGSLHSTSTDTIAPRNSAMLVPSGDNRGQGWAHIVSDQPVALSGSTPTQVGDPVPVRVNMAFYREPLQDIPDIHPLPD